jgi:hypothetical protein
MAWRQPKRNGKSACGHRGQCSCQRRITAELSRNPAAAPRACSVKLPNGKICGKTVRGGVCPSPDH